MITVGTSGGRPENLYPRPRLPRPYFIYAEDDPDAVFLVRAALRKLKAEHLMMHYADGEELLRSLLEPTDRAELPTFILLDVRMPKASGFEALLRIRSSPSLASLPVVMFTSSPLEADIRLAGFLGATDYQVKPPTIEELARGLSELLHRFQLRSSGLANLGILKPKPANYGNRRPQLCT